jgi:hypothetical protein
MNDEMYNKFYDQAVGLYKTYNNKIKGQQVSSMDNLSYWIMYVAYREGYDKAYGEGYEHGTNDILKSGREI